MVQRTLRYDAIAGHFVMEQREEDLETDRQEDAMRQAQAQAAWLAADAKLKRDDQRRCMFDAAIGFVAGVVFFGFALVLLNLILGAL